MNGYVIANIDVKNIEAYKEYVEKVSPIVKKFGGEYLICLLYTSDAADDW